jgi:hypothetical protein
MEGQQKWYESLTIRGAIISALVFVVNVFKLEIGSDEITQLVTGVFGFVSLVMIIYGRIRAKYVING